MNLKLRFALLFTSFVAVILIISSIAIYILYYNFRAEDFYTRIQKEGLNVYQTYNKKDAFKDSTFSIQNKYSLVSREVVIFDSNYAVLNKFPDTVHLKFNLQFFKKVVSQNEYRFHDGKRECIGLYMADTKNYIYASAYDRYGLRKLQNIKLILLGVFGSSLLLAL